VVLLEWKTHKKIMEGLERERWEVRDLLIE
jgi:hypothetical protein